MWAHPNETVVENLLSPGNLSQIMRASYQFPGKPIPILCLPQVSAYRGMLLPVPLGGGFSSLSDLVSEATTGGKGQKLLFNKVGATGVANATSTLWFTAGTPNAGSNGAALAAGTDCTSTTTGALRQANAAGGDTLHIVSAFSMPTVGSNCLLLFDRIWHGLAAASTAGAQTVTSTLTRYATTGATGTSIGNFCAPEVNTNLGATAHTWTIQYTDDAGNGVETTAGNVGVSGCVTPRIDVAAAAPWNAVLNGNDVGLSDISQWTTGASVTGNINICVGHPLGFIPQPTANQMVILNGINDAFNLERVYDNACLSFFELFKNATTATTYNGIVQLVSG
jgi:hypothetical protein